MQGRPSRRKLGLGIWVILALSAAPVSAYNPLIYQQFTADPTAFWDTNTNRMYIVCTHDITGQTGYGMNNDYLISSDDLVNWTDHGILNQVPRDASWAGLIYAPDMIYRNGFYYIYYGNGGGSIGVFRSTSPTGPYTDPLGKALITSATAGVSPITYIFDPAAFIDDDGQAYLYFGGGGVGNGRGIKLNTDMISVNGSAVSIAASRYFEAPFVNKVNGTYYFTYSTDFSASPAASIDYLTSTNPLAGFTHRGTVLNNPPNNCGNNDHASIVNVGTNYYIAYHSRDLALLFKGLTCGGTPDAVFQRSVNLDRVTFNSDGTVALVTPTTGGVAALKNQNPYSTLRAVMMAKETGIQTGTCSEGGMDVTGITNGSWVQVRNLDFGSGAATFTARVAGTVSGGAIQVRLDSPTGTIVGTLSVPNTGGTQTWQTVSCPVTGATGLHDLFFVFTGGSGTLFNFESYSFSQSNSATSTPTRTNTPVPPTATSTRTATNTSTLTRTWTSTGTFTPSATSTKTNTAVPATATSTATLTASRTSTSVPATSTTTFTPTATSTRTHTNIPPTSTLTATSTRTNTLVPPTATSTASGTPTLLSTPTLTSTRTSTLINTPTNSATMSSTATLIRTSTVSPTSTPTAVSTATSTTTQVSTSTRTSTATSIGTATSTPTLANSPTFTATPIPTNSFTPTQTLLNTPTSTSSMTATASSTVTKTATGTPSATPTSTSSMTPTSSLTVTRIPTASATGTRTSTLTFTATGTFSATPTQTPTVTRSITPTLTGTATATQTVVVGETPVVFPNPVTGPTVKVLPQDYPGTSDVRVSVFTVAFKRVAEKTFQGVPHGVAVTLDLIDSWGQPLANGLYYVQVATKKSTAVVKLMVQR